VITPISPSRVKDTSSLINYAPPKNLGTPAPLRAVFAERLPARARAYPGFSEEKTCV
jgi:hypothetical protein